MVPIGDEMAIDDLRQLAFQAAERLARRLVLGELALVMVAPGARMHGLDPSREMQRVVERAIAAPGQAVPRANGKRGGWSSRLAWIGVEPQRLVAAREDVHLATGADAHVVNEMDIERRP
jgi:hypothetical protein